VRGHRRVCADARSHSPATHRLHTHSHLWLFCWQRGALRAGLRNVPPGLSARCYRGQPIR
ncbi:hypothetical protein AAVH_37710, partial [Aphelenchoides avenae]